MTKVAYVQPIFAPDKARLTRNLESLVSMSEYIKEYPYDISFYFGGWAKEEFWPEIQDTITKLFSGYTVVLKKFERNYGKATVVNTLMKQVTSTYILSADSDMVFKIDQPNMFERLVFFADNSMKIRGKPFGMVATHQIGQCCHLELGICNKQEYTNHMNEKELIGYPNSSAGIAGGCIFFTNESWTSVGGYREMGVYAGDDAYFLIDLYKNGRSIQVLESLGVIHPHDHDEEYAKWKVKVCQRDSGAASISEKVINEAEKFWSDRAD